MAKKKWREFLGTMALRPMFGSTVPWHFNAAPACPALFGVVPSWMTCTGLGPVDVGIYPATRRPA
ncbi:MAG: hypothetical protein F4213_04130 [Boseongicola sp. SB0677_bin_26]|nr:hypothetical protein [Boseongicola sp. SB0665_bin_10]MYG25198.1 hypothetical protein [Boseongicola sp. SB0677_bin_26]